jgi:hypothetical protein
MFEGRLEAMPRQAKLDRTTLEMALIGYEAEKARLQAAIVEIRAQLGGNADGAKSAPKKRSMSAAARARIAEAQRKRWAAQRHATEAPAHPKRKLTAAGRKAIAEATKKRWAAFHKAQAAAKGMVRKAVRKTPVQRAAAAGS